MRTERLQAAFELEVVHTYFPLHPETPDEGRSLHALFAGRAQQLEQMHSELTRLLEAEGLPFGKREQTFNSRRAQELAKWAAASMDARALHSALYRAYFVDGINLARVEELVRLAGSVGLPEDEARDVLERRSWSDAVDADWARAQRLGVTGVPTYIVGDRGMAGAQPLEVLEQLVRAAGAVPRTG